METTELKTSELLSQILIEIRNSSKNNRLWDANDIAEYLKLSKGTVQNRIVCKVSFPDPIRILTYSGKTNPRWEPAEVKAWVKKFRVKK